MKKEISPLVIAAVIVVFLSVLGGMAWYLMNGEAPGTARYAGEHGAMKSGNGASGPGKAGLAGGR